MLLLHLHTGWCVQPILKIRGSQHLNRVSKTFTAWERTLPANAPNPGSWKMIRPGTESSHSCWTSTSSGMALAWIEKTSIQVSDGLFRFLAGLQFSLCFSKWSALSSLFERKILEVEQSNRHWWASFSDSNNLELAEAPEELAHGNGTWSSSGEMLVFHPNDIIWFSNNSNTTQHFFWELQCTWNIINECGIKQPSSWAVARQEFH